MNQVFKETLGPLWRSVRSPRWREFYRLHARLHERPRFEPTRVRVLDLDIEAPDGRSLLWQYKDLFVDESLRFRPDRQDPCIFDCGANLGMASLYFARSFPRARIRAFEGDPGLAELLRRNLRHNQANQVEVTGKAVWIHDRGVAFAQQGADAGSLFGPGPKVDVPSLRLRDELEREARVDLLKLDIEGAEVDVLLDCARALARVERLAIEFHAIRGEPQRLDELLRLLRDSGYRYQIRASSERQHPLVAEVEQPWMDVKADIFATRSHVE